MVTWKIENGVLKGWIGDSPFKKPVLVDGEVVEGWTQADQDALDEQIADFAVLEVLEQEIVDGIEASNQLKIYLKRNLTEAQYKNARVTVRPVWEALRNGDWDIALDEMNAIDLPTEPFATMKQTIINKLEAYLGI